MGKLKIIKKTAFREFYESLPGNKKADFVNEVKTTLSIEKTTFYRRLDKPTFFSPLEQKAIADLAGRSVAELFPVISKDSLKTKLLIVLITLCTIANAQGPAAFKIDDRTLHMYAGLGISVATGAFVYHKTKKPLIASLSGFAASCLIGVAKEVIYDKAFGFGVCSNRDAYNTFWGGAVGSMCFSIGLNVHKSSVQEKEYFQHLSDSLLVAHPRNH